MDPSRDGKEKEAMPPPYSCANQGEDAPGEEPAAVAESSGVGAPGGKQGKDLQARKTEGKLQRTSSMIVTTPQAERQATSSTKKSRRTTLA